MMPQPGGTIDFPFGHSETPTPLTRVRGRLSPVAGSTIVAASILVGASSYPAAISPDATFRADVPLAAGANVLTLSVTDSLGRTNASAASTTLTRRHEVRNPRVITYDTLRDRLLAYDNLYDAAYFTKAGTLVSIDPTTNVALALSGPTRGTGLLVRNADDLAYDSERDVIYVLDAFQGIVLQIDPVNGNRTLLSGSASNPASTNLGTGPFGSARSIAVDTVNDRLLVTTNAAPTAYVFAIALTGAGRGNRTPIASSTVGSGTVPTSANPIVVAGTLAYLQDYSLHAIFRIDLTTNARTIISQNNDGKGPNFGTSGSVSGVPGLAFDSNGDLLATDFYANAVLRVVPSTGVRTVVSSTAVGTGTGFVDIGRLARRSGTAIVADGQSGRLVDVALPAGNRTTRLQSRPPSPVSGSLIYLPVAVAGDARRAYVLETLAKVLAVDYATGNTTLLSANTAAYTGPAIAGSDLATDPATGRLLSIQPGTNVAGTGHLISIDPTSGNRALISAPDAGLGPSLWRSRGLAVAPNGSDAWTLDVRSFNNPFQIYVMRIALGTGDRTVIYDNNVGGGTTLISPQGGLGVDLTRNRALVCDEATDVAFTVGLGPPNTGVIASFSSGDDPSDPTDLVVGTGPDFEYELGVTADPAVGRLYLWDELNMGLFAIDPSTAARTVIASNTLGRGPMLAQPFTDPRNGGADNPVDIADLAIGPTPGTLLVLSNMDNAVLILDVETGDRVSVLP